MLCPLVGDVQVWIEGNIDYEGSPYLHGTVVATLPLMCQRCLRVVHYPLSTEFFLKPVFNDDEIKGLSSSYEPLYLFNSTVSLLEMIEDELLLGLPLTIKHEGQDCFIKN